MSKHFRNPQSIEVTLYAPEHERYAASAAAGFVGAPLKDEAGNILGYITEAHIEDGGRVVRFTGELPKPLDNAERVVDSAQ